MDYHQAAIAVMAICPCETTVIAGDIALKTSKIEMGFLDRFSGTLIFTGRIGNVEASVKAVLAYLDTHGDHFCLFAREKSAALVTPRAWEDLSVMLTANEGAGFPVRRLPTVTTDAPYRQTFWKEEQWRELGCAAVDMEASAVATVCTYYGMACTVALMVSDKHPVREGDPPWTWGSRSFAESRDRFIAQCAAFALGQKL